jgi:ferredoxin-NADP reductase
MAMIRSRIAAANTAPCRLLYSVREPGAIYYSDELNSLSARDSAVMVTYVYTRATPKGWVRPPSRIDAAVIANTTLPSKIGPTCYVCGPTPFVENAAGLLSACGNQPAKIKTERFGPTGGKK